MSVKILIQFYEQLAQDLEIPRKKVAEYTSLYPDLSMKFPYKSPMEAIAVLSIVGYIIPPRNEYYKYKIKEEMAQRCYNYNYQGKWKIVQELLELSPDYPADILRYLEQHFSPETIFGNIVPMVRKMLLLMKLNKNINRRNKVKKPQRKRGYNDKGTLRFPHEIHRAWTSSYVEHEREDRRDKIKAPNRPILWKTY